jgi:hypothetical protein
MKEGRVRPLATFLLSVHQITFGPHLKRCQMFAVPLIDGWMEEKAPGGKMKMGVDG